MTNLRRKRKKNVDVKSRLIRIRNCHRRNELVRVHQATRSRASEQEEIQVVTVPLEAKARALAWPIQCSGLLIGALRSKCLVTQVVHAHQMETKLRSEIKRIVSYPLSLLSETRVALRSVRSM